MVCIYCRNETIVINSRHQKRRNSTWRRRKCPNCLAVFTTQETFDLSLVLKVNKKDGVLEDFQKEKIYLSVYRSISHLGENKPIIARDLTESILERILALQSLKNAQISSIDIARAIILVLKNYDLSSALKYLSSKKKLSSIKNIKNYLEI